MPVELNITDQGFPDKINGLKAWQKAFNSTRFSHVAFATSVVLTPDGAVPLGTSGSGFAWEWRTAPNYHPERYLGFLNDALNRFNRMCGVETTSQLD